MDEEANGKRIRVLKTYDPAFAREVFQSMDEAALGSLRLTLEQEALPDPGSPDFAEAVWQEVEDSAREDWNAVSYFVVTEETKGETTLLFVSADWPSAGAFAEKRLQALA